MTTESTTAQTPLAAPAREGLSVALEALARLLEYPAAGLECKIEDAATVLQRLADDWPAARIAFERFRNRLCGLSGDQCEELYTATFDVTPACVPWVSIHLFGEENFKRGEFMAALHARYQQRGFVCCGELPDHVSILLRFAAVAGEDERRELTQYCLLGPLEKMIAALAPDNPYRSLLEAVLTILRAAHPGTRPALSPLEQMQRHGGGCPTITASCGCGIVPNQDPFPANSFAASAGKTRPIATIPFRTNEPHD